MSIDDRPRGEEGPWRIAVAVLRFLGDHLPVLVLFLCASLSLATWYGGQELVWGDDATHPLSLSEISVYFHIPDPGLGAPDARKLPFILPAGALLAGWRALGIPYDLLFVQPIVVAGLLFIAGWSSYLLVRTLLRPVGKLAAFGGALLYMFNLYSLTTIWSSMSYLSFHYAFLPLVLTAWFVVLTRPVSGWLVPPVAALWALTLTPAYITTPLVVTDSILLAGVVVFAAVRTRHARPAGRVVVRGASLYVLWLAMNLFWIIPVVTFVGAETARGLAVGNPLELFKLNSAPFFEAIRLAGYWGVSATTGGSPYFPWYSYFADIGLPAAFAMPIVALIGLLAVVRSGRLLRPPAGASTLSGPSPRSFFAFFALMLLASLTLMVGANEPLGGLKLWVVETFGLTGPFRSVYQRFGVYVAIAYVPLVAVGIWVLQRVVRDRFGQLAAGAAAIAAIVAVAVVPALPLWTGNAFDRSGINASRRITIPTDYRRLASVFDETPGDFNVLVLPYGGKLGVSVLSWADGSEGYQGLDPLALLTSRPVLTNDASARYLEALVQDVANGGQRSLEALQLLNARYVVLHHDANITQLENGLGWIGLDVDRIDDRLEQLPDVKLVFASKFLRAYSWTGWRPYRFFAAEHPSKYETRRPVPGLERRELLEPFAFSSMVSRRRLPYSVDHAGRYVVDTSSLRGDELLMMNQPFDAEWRAGGARPLRVDPGVTAFDIGARGEIVVSHSLDERFPLLLAVVPVVLLGCATSLGLALASRRKTAGV